MSEAQTRANLPAGGQSEVSEKSQLRPGVHGQRAAGAGVPAQTEGALPCHQRLPAAAASGAGPLAACGVHRAARPAHISFSSGLFSLTDMYIGPKCFCTFARTVVYMSTTYTDHPNPDKPRFNALL